MRHVAAAVLLCIAPVLAHAAPRFIGPWFTDQSYNTATQAMSLTAGQNTTTLGITFTCFDRGLILGVWKPTGSLGLEIARKTGATVQIDQYPPIELVGVGTQRNLAEFDLNIGLVMREMLAGRQAMLVFADQQGNEIRESFPLDNAAIAFAGLAGACPL